MGALGKIPLQAGKNPMGALGKIPLQAGKKGVPCLWLSFLYILSSFFLFLGSPPIDGYTVEGPLSGPFYYLFLIPIAAWPSSYQRI